MNKRRDEQVSFQVVELDGVRYAILREAALLKLCQRARVQAAASAGSGSRAPGTPDEIELDGQKLARRLVLRRKRAGLGQAELARRAGIRVETLNRLERGKTTPDFSTIRRLVEAMNQAESELEISATTGATAGQE